MVHGLVVLICTYTVCLEKLTDSFIASLYICDACCRLFFTNHMQVMKSFLLNLQISYFSESAALSDRSRYKRYFRTNPSGNIEYPAFRSIMRHFGWKQIAILTQDEDLFTTVGSRAYLCAIISSTLLFPGPSNH